LEAPEKPADLRPCRPFGAASSTLKAAVQIGLPMDHLCAAKKTGMVRGQPEAETGVRNRVHKKTPADLAGAETGAMEL
jgi:hypothetical protein